MAIGRISGSMLVSNLDRQGTDLQFTTNNQPLVYMNFSQFLTAINTNVATHTLTINGNISTSNVVVDGLNIFAKQSSDTLAFGGLVNLGTIGNVKLQGGFPDYILSTNGAGDLTWANLQTLTQLEGFNGNNIPLGSNSVGSFSNALVFTTATKVTDAIALLNQSVGNVIINTSAYQTLANANIGAYQTWANANLSTQTTNFNTLNANIGAYQVWANANLSTQTTNFNTLNANIGAYQTWANANASSQAGSINSINANIGAYQTWANANLSTQTTNFNTLNANVGAYQVWANANASSQAGSINSINANITAANAAIATLQTQVYSNANVASYLTVFNGNINSGNIGISGKLSVDYISSNVTTAVTFTGNSAIRLPIGTNIERPIGATGYIRYNTDNSQVEYFNGTAWIPVTSTVTDQTITGNGVDDTFTLDQNATAIGVLVSINGTVQNPGTAYSIAAGDQITFAEIPLPSDVINVRFLGSLITLDNTLADDLVVSGNISLSGLLQAPQVTKASTAPGATGQICWDANYIYVCTSTNTWKRSPLTGGY